MKIELENVGTANTGAEIEKRVENLLERMTLDEKIGQMTQVEKNSITPEDVANYFIGSILSGGGGNPTPNNPESWAAMTGSFQKAALTTRLGIPIIYGVDAVHGHNNVIGATIFPHNVGLGATRDADLVERTARATAVEIAATGVWWDFAPAVCAPQDIRWGRAYEGFSENTQVVSDLGVAYLRGLQNKEGRPNLADTQTALATPKHYIGDGATAFGSSKTNNFLLDQGDARIDEATLRAKFLPPYRAVIEAGALCIMASYNSWNGQKLHGHKYLLTDVLKGELGFKGFIVSDWWAIDQIAPSYYDAVVQSINAGLDMVMVPYDYKKFISALKEAVQNGDVSKERINDAVRRILSVKLQLGLFERPFPDPNALSQMGAAEHRAIAREAVRKSLVLLKNENKTLPLSKSTRLILVAGQAADDIGFQCGGWTIEWAGKPGSITPGTTILGGLKDPDAADARIEFDPNGDFGGLATSEGMAELADVGIVVLSEPPYSEGAGDRSDLTFEDEGLVARMRSKCKKLVLILLSGRPMIVTHLLPQCDAFVAAWLPGSEANGIADVLFGDFPFTGKLPFTWPRSNDQLPFNFDSLPSEGEGAPLFPFGHGLTS